MQQLPRPKFTYTIDQAQQATGIGRTRIFRLIKDGALDARKFGKSTLITAESLEAFLNGLPRSKSAA